MTDPPAAAPLFRVMVVCPICGNKRCPHATDHNLPCTGSNEPGQPVADNFLSPIVNDPATIAVDRWSLSDAIRRAWLRHGQDSWCSIADDVINEMRETQSEVTVAEEPPTIVRYEFEITDEHDQTVASGDAATLEEAEREGRHYLARYQQDGPCTLELRRVEVVEVLSPEPQPQPAAAKPPLWRVMHHATDWLAAPPYDNAPAPPRGASGDWTDRVGYVAQILAVRDRLFPGGRPDSVDCLLIWDELTTEAARAEAGE